MSDTARSVTASTSNPADVRKAEVSAPFHSLALDIEGNGFWPWIDRCVEQVSGWLNPILIKEARQSLKSRQFLITFFLLLTASVLWTILGVVLNAPDVYFVPQGENLLTGYYFVLAIPMMGILPLAAYRSLAEEIDNDTFEMLVITRLSSMRIVLGKMNSAILQMLIYFAAIVPCLAFSYLLRGIDLPTVAMVLLVVFVNSLLLTSFALMLATLAPHRMGQTMLLLSLIAVIFIAEFTCAGFCLFGILDENAGSDPASIMMTAVFTLVSASCIAVFLKAAAARVAPVSENRATGLRWCMFAQQLIWIGAIAVISQWYGDPEVLNFGIMVVGGYWLLMGTLMLAESPELSPRVQRDLPHTVAGRILLTWFNPGPGTGYVFAIASGTIGCLSLGVFSMFVESQRSPRTDSHVFAVLLVGYLLSYLGAIRLISLPLTYRLGRSIWVPIGTAIAVMVAAALLPTVLSVLTTGAPPYSYAPLEAIDWAWSLVEAFETRFDPVLALMVMLVGIVLTLVNLALCFREFGYRRISVPRRVVEDRSHTV